MKVLALLVLDHSYWVACITYLAVPTTSFKREDQQPEEDMSSG